MKFTYNWLLDYFVPNCDFDQILSGLFSLGLEVEKVIDYNKILEAFTVGEILETAKHETSDRLSICKVKTINGIKSIVCGAPNTRNGTKVIFADMGTYIPENNLLIEERNIRGVKSYGMMLSERELCIGNNHDTIIEVDSSVNVGTPANIALGLVNERFIEVATTPNLGHLLSVKGIASSLASLGLGSFKSTNYPTVLKNIWVYSPNAKNTKWVHYTSYKDFKLNKVNSTSDKPFLNLQVNKEISSGYIVTKLTKVNNFKPLPFKISNRLKLIGQSLINPVVDILNYLTIDINHPMHAYNKDTLGNKLLVDYGNKEDSLVALDHKTYNNLESIPLVKANSAISIAGVIGGLDSSINNNCSNILLECAYFYPVIISKTISSIHINTISSYHFQRGVNPSDLLEATNLVAYFLKEFVDAEIEEIYYVRHQCLLNTLSIKTTYKYINNLLGTSLSNNLILEYLTKENLNPSSISSNDIVINVPHYRYDIKNEADVAELILKLYGIHNIPSVSFKKDSQSVPIINKYPGSPNKVLDSKTISENIFDLSLSAKKILASLGLLENINMSFISEATAKLFNTYNPELHLSNPISSDLSVMRSSLIPSLVMSVHTNYKDGYPNLKFFEVANIYSSISKYELTASAILNGINHYKDWRFKSVAYNVFDIKELMYNLLNNLGLNLDLNKIKTIPVNLPIYFHPFKSGKVCINHLGKNFTLGYFGELHPNITKSYHLKSNPVVFEVFLQRLLEHIKNNNNYLQVSFSRLNPIERDFAFVVDYSTPAELVINAVLSIKSSLITNVQIFDLFIIDKKFKSIGISVTISPLNKSLSENQINELSNKIIKIVEKVTCGKLREEPTLSN